MAMLADADSVECLLVVATPDSVLEIIASPGFPTRE